MLHESCEASAFAGTVVEQEVPLAQGEQQQAQKKEENDTQQQQSLITSIRMLPGVFGAGCQAALERTATALSLTIATLLYVHLFASVVVTSFYAPFSRTGSTSSALSASFGGVYNPTSTSEGQQQQLRAAGWDNHWNRRRTRTLFRDTEELRFAVDSWLDNKDDALKRFGSISAWNVSLIVDMNRLFDSAVDFDEDLDQWDVSRVKNMSAMFRGTRRFAGVSLQRWDTSSVEDFSHMFEDSSVHADLSAWDVGAGRKFDYMFQNCDQFKFNSDSPRLSISGATTMHVATGSPSDTLERLNESSQLVDTTGGGENQVDDDLQQPVETIHTLEKAWAMGEYDDDIFESSKVLSKGHNALFLAFVGHSIALVTLFAFCNRTKTEG